MENTKICCICGKEIIGWGNDPWPVSLEKTAWCCDACNYAVVLPARLAGMGYRKGANNVKSN